MVAAVIDCLRERLRKGVVRVRDSGLGQALVARNRRGRSEERRICLAQQA